MEKHFPHVLEKFKKLGLHSLSPSEVCMTCMVPSWGEYFYSNTRSDWSEQLDLYLPFLETHLDNPDKAHRFAAGKIFLQCLDSYSTSEKIQPKYSIVDDGVLKKISQTLKEKNISLLQLLLNNDKNCDGFMTKSELLQVFEKLELSPFDIISALRIAGFRDGVDFVSIASFCDLIGRVNSERKLKEYNILTKLLNLFAKQPGGTAKVFKVLDKNGDGHISLNEFRNGVFQLGIDLSIKECKYIFAILDRDNSNTVSLHELGAKLASIKGNSKRIVQTPNRNNEFTNPGEIIITLLKGNLPHDAIITLTIQNASYSTTQFPCYGEICRLKTTKSLTRELQISTAGIPPVKIKIAACFSKETLFSAKIGHFSLQFSASFELHIGADYKEIRAATLIQRAWRVYRQKVFTKGPKKLATRKTIAIYGKRFLLGIYTIDSGYYCQLHPTDTSQIPADTIIASAAFPHQPLEELLEKIQINPNLTLSTTPQKLRIKGNLWVELVKIVNANQVDLVLTEKKTSLASVGDKFEFKDLAISRICDLTYEVNGNTGGIGWMHALYTPFRWSVTSVVNVPGKTCVVVRFKWVPGARIGEIEQAAAFIQKQWKEKKKQQSVVERKKVKKGGKVYVISVGLDADRFNVTLHVLENNGKYLLLDTQVTALKDPKEIISRVKILNNKISF